MREQKSETEVNSQCTRKVGDHYQCCQVLLNLKEAHVRLIHHRKSFAQVRPRRRAYTHPQDRRQDSRRLVRRRDLTVHP